MANRVFLDVTYSKVPFKTCSLKCNIYHIYTITLYYKVSLVMCLWRSYNAKVLWQTSTTAFKKVNRQLHISLCMCKWKQDVCKKLVCEVVPLVHNFNKQKFPLLRPFSFSLVAQPCCSALLLSLVAQPCCSALLLSLVPRSAWDDMQGKQIMETVGANLSLPVLPQLQFSAHASHTIGY
jgi:hypothetical protein